MLALTLLATLVARPIANAQTPEPTETLVSDSLVLLLDGEPDLTVLDSALAERGMRLGRTWPGFGLAEVLIAPDQLGVRAAGIAVPDATIQSLSGLPGILDVEADSMVVAADRLASETLLPAGSPSDPLLSAQWAFAQLDVAGAWEIGQGHRGVSVAVIDSGYDVTHEDIDAAALWINAAERDGLAGVDDDDNGFVDDLNGWDWVENDNVTNDLYGHGTHVGGTIAAIADNNLGVAGLGHSVSIAPLRVLDERGSGRIVDLIDALYYVYEQKIPIINMSLVLNQDSTALHWAVQALAEEDILLVAASGNSSTFVYWPARYAETIAVAATDPADLRASFSNFGPEVDLAAPGLSVISTHVAGSYKYLSGTSMATAHVSALAALLWSLRPDLTVNELQSIMQVTAVDANAQSYPGADSYLGAGRIDFKGALYLASMPLKLTSDSLPPLFAGVPFTVSIQVDAGNSADTPVPGAVIQAELSPDQATAQTGASSYSGRAISSQDGNALLVLDGVTSPGAYTLLAKVGAATLELPVTIHDSRIVPTLTPPDGVVVADVEFLFLRLELRDPEGVLTTRPTTVRVQSDRGWFEDGQSETTVLVTDGVHLLPFAPGETAGNATLSIEVNGLSYSVSVQISPGQPAALGPATAVSPVFNVTVSGSSTIELAIVDSYGNAVADGTIVHLSVDRGALEETVLASVGGMVTTKLTVPMGLAGPVKVSVSIPDTSVVAEIEVPLLNRGAWLPRISTE